MSACVCPRCSPCGERSTSRNAFNTLRRDGHTRGRRAPHTPSCRHTRQRRTAGTAICSSGSFRCSHRRGRSRGIRLRDRSTSAWPSTHLLTFAAVVDAVVGYLDDMSMGGEADRVAEDFTSAGGRRSRSSASHSTDPECEVRRAHRMRRARFWAARGVALPGEIPEHSGGLGSPRILHYWQAEGSTPCCHPSGVIWRHWPADCLSCRPMTASSSCATS